MGKGLTFEPRKILLGPKVFGREQGIRRPADGISVEDPRYLAANLQHVFSFHIRQQLQAEGHDVAWLASPAAGHTGVSVDRMRRMLRGETMMQLTDVMLIVSHVPKLLPVLVRVLSNGEVTVFDQLQKARAEIVALERFIEEQSKEIARVRSRVTANQIHEARRAK